MKTDIAIIGCGSTGKATAAWLTLRGYKVTLCDTASFLGDMEEIRAKNGILLRGGCDETGKAMPEFLTTDFAQALEVSHRVLICAPASRHEELARLCAPHLRKEHYVVIVPGNLGSLIFRQVLTEYGKCGESAPFLAEISDNLWACRTTGPSEILVALPLKAKRIAALPSVHTSNVIAAFEDIFPLLPGKNILETTLNSPNVVTHVAGTIPNATAVEKSGGTFAFFHDGLTPSVIRCAKAVEKERDAVLAAMGLDRYGPVTELCEMLMTGNIPQGFDTFVSLDGPGTLTHRYVSEDASCGMALLVSLGDLCHTDVSLSKALLTMASCINEEDYLKKGRTLSNLGLGGLNRNELLSVL